MKKIVVIIFALFIAFVLYKNIQTHSKTIADCSLGIDEPRRTELAKIAENLGKKSRHILSLPNPVKHHEWTSPKGPYSSYMLEKAFSKLDDLPRTIQERLLLIHYFAKGLDATYINSFSTDKISYNLEYNPRIYSLFEDVFINQEVLRFSVSRNWGNDGKMIGMKSSVGHVLIHWLWHNRQKKKQSEKTCPEV